MSDAAQPEELDFESLLAHMASPTLPSDAIANSRGFAEFLKDLDAIPTVAVLAGLQTEPQFQAHTVRFEWAIRLVLALASGSIKPCRSDLDRILNGCLAEAGVSLLEDPIEDFFVEPVPTANGDFLLLSGTWEQAAFYTETLLSAFTRLPDGEPKRDAVRMVTALLRLSDALVRRADLQRRQIGGGDAKGRIELPNLPKLKALAKRVLFTWAELSDLGFDPADFQPFLLADEHADHLLDAAPGNSMLDFRPLIELADGIFVASPTNLTTAVRALLIDTAVQGGMANVLQRRLLDTQAEAVGDSGFARLEGFPVGRAGRFLLRGYGREISTGRFVNYVQTMDDFNGWPASAFGNTIDEPELAAAILDMARAAKAEFERRGRVAEGITICFLGGWGAGRTLEIPDDPNLAEWEFIFLSPGDAAAIARCDGGTIRDLWRLQKQRALVEQQGFQLLAINGLLNLFHWWRISDHALIPEGWTEFAPPAIVQIGTDHLLAARREGFEALDRRAFPHPDGTYKVVTRLESKGSLGGLMPIYGSVTDVRNGDFVFAVHAEPLIVWIHLDAPSVDRNSYDRYETIKAAAKWLDLLLPAFWRRFGATLGGKPVAMTLSVEWPATLSDRQLRDDEIQSTVLFHWDQAASRAHLTLKPEWQYALRRADNLAEVELAAALLCIVARALGSNVPMPDLRAFVLEVAGSTDLRWRHVFQVSQAIDMLKYHGLIDPMRPIPISAGALIKCGSAFRVHAREDGVEIHGKEACRDFLVRQTDALTAELCGRVRTFNKLSFLKTALAALQAAQGEIRSWASTARANRAIHGVREDYRGSLERSNEANGVVRSASLLAEIANAEAQADGGFELGDMDFAELQATSLLILQLADVIPTIMGDWIEPKVGISPTGDVLTDHRFFENTLQRSAERRHEAARAHDSDAYASRFADDCDPKPLHFDFRAAITAEYGADSEAVLDLAYATARMAATRKRGVMVMPRDELIAALEAFDGMKGQRLASLIDRLTMPTRQGWADVPAGFSQPEFDITRFDRRPSLTARPIIALTSEVNPPLVVAPGAIERMIFHNLAGAHSGALQNQFWSSRQMRTFASAAGMKAGLEFNDIVATHVKGAGLRTWPSAKPAWALNCKATPEVEALGDVDVLAVSVDGSRVWVIEAKDLKLCRTMGEIARRLSEYRGRQDEKGRPDKMLRHLRRVAHLREHAAELVGRLGLPGTPQISGAVVVRSPQPMEHVQVAVFDARVVMFDDIDIIPWQRGWSE